ncbi:MAG: xanthine dehydrogenase family protein molybdopterin-binding subunit [Pseudohongiellaceae bacterium]
MEKFGVGQAATRIEDRRFTAGRGQYIEDLTLPNQSWGVFTRSPHAHARILEIDTDSVSDLPGVLGVYTCADLRAADIGDLPCNVGTSNIDGSPCYKPPRPALADRIVRFVGDPVALVVAETRSQAIDAAEQLWVDYEPLDAVVETGAALADGQPQIWESARHNQCFHWQAGDQQATNDAFASADKVVAVELVNNRVIPNSMETRGAIADTDNGRLVLHVSCQGVHMLRRMLAGQIFNVPEQDIHVLCHDVGGGFGMKIFMYPEYVATMFAARQLNRPVKWIAERSEAFVSDTHGRDHISRLELALDSAARIKGLRVKTTANMGAYLSQAGPFVATDAGVAMLVGCYDIAAAHVEVKGVFTNTAPVDAYRGAGRPEAIYAIERAMDVAAGEMGITPDDIRRRNFISPQQMPYSTALGATYDSGDFGRNMEDAMRLARWEEFPQRRQRALAEGKLRGIGLASYIERCAGGAPEQARLTVDKQGHVTLYIGTQSNGQGHETAFRQILCERLGLGFDDITVVQGDSDLIATGGGTMGSRSVPVGGSAIGMASEKIIERAKAKAAELMECAVSDVEFTAGEFRIVGTDRIQSFKAVAAAASEAASQAGQPGFDEAETFAPEVATFPNGTHVCELEIDRDTGVIDIVDYTVVDDFGRVINPLLLEGQVHGGIAQGIGQALLEYCAYESDSGQLVSASFMDYTMPRADHLPMIRFQRNEVPCTTNPLGIKGAGEAGAIGAPPAVVNAVVNALAEHGVRHLDMPITANRIWQILQSSPGDK